MPIKFVHCTLEYMVDISIPTLQDTFSKQHIRLPKPSAARHTLSVVLLSLDDVTQLRHTISFWKKSLKNT